MLNGWLEAQNSFMKNWFGAMQGNPFLNLVFPGMLDQWRRLSEESVQALDAETASSAKATARQFLASQNEITRFMAIFMDAWRAQALQARSPEEWQATISQYTSRMREQWMQSPASVFKTSQNLADLWKLYMDEIQKFSGPWLASLLQMPGQLVSRNGDTPELIEVANLYWDAYEKTLGRLMVSPSLGYSREFNEKLGRSFQIWVDYRRVDFEYQSLLTDTWINAFESLLQKLVTMAQKNEAVTSLRQLLNLWIETADAEFIELFHTEDYAKVQAQLLNHAMAAKRQQRELVEIGLRTNDLPTRTELEDAHRSIYELRKEVRGLRKELAITQAMVRGAAETTAGAANGAPAKKPAGKRSSKPKTPKVQAAGGQARET